MDRYTRKITKNTINNSKIILQGIISPIIDYCDYKIKESNNVKDMEKYDEIKYEINNITEQIFDLLYKLEILIEKIE